jgi:hypothetical protein
MPGYSSVSPAATQGLPLYRCKCYATEPVYPQEGVTSLHRCVHGVEKRPYAQTTDGVPARRDSTCRPKPWRTASGADDTREGRDAWPAWGEGSGGLVVRAYARQEDCCCGTTRRRAARPPKTPEGRRARWRRAYRVLGDGHPLAPAGASGTAPHPGALRKPALWRGAHTEMVDIEGRRTRTVTLRAAGTPLTDALAEEGAVWSSLRGPPASLSSFPQGLVIFLTLSPSQRSLPWAPPAR